MNKYAAPSLLFLEKKTGLEFKGDRASLYHPSNPLSKPSQRSGGSGGAGDDDHWRMDSVPTKTVRRRRGYNFNITTCAAPMKKQIFYKMPIT